MMLPMLVWRERSQGRSSTCLGALACLLAMPCAAQSTASVGSLSFGAFVVSGAGTITVATTGARSKTGSVYLLSQGAGASAAQFVLTGSANATYAITLPANGVVTLEDGGGHAMSIDSFVSNPAGSSSLANDGTGQLTVGATLVIGAAQVPGSYTGTFSMTLDYQ